MGIRFRFFHFPQPLEFFAALPLLSFFCPKHARALRGIPPESRCAIDLHTVLHSELDTRECNVEPCGFCQILTASKPLIVQTKKYLPITNCSVHALPISHPQFSVSKILPYHSSSPQPLRRDIALSHYRHHTTAPSITRNKKHPGRFPRFVCAPESSDFFGKSAKRREH